jgi:hypothetical protein
MMPEGRVTLPGIRLSTVHDSMSAEVLEGCLQVDNNKIYLSHYDVQKTYTSKQVNAEDF